MATTRTGLFPTVVRKEETLPKSEIKQRGITKAKIKTERTPVTSILKRKNESADKRKSAPASLTPSSGRHVKFKTKASEQESLREKLNTWLVAKGKTPSRCRHLMCFNAEVSAKKKTQGKLVDRTVTQNLLSDQLAVLENEERVENLFESSPSDAQRSGEKENRRTRRSIRFNDEVDQTGKKLKKECDSHKRTPVPITETQSPGHGMVQSSASAPERSDEKVLEHLKFMLEECLTLYDAGCPLDSLLPWLKEIESHIPRAHTFAPYYICKAKVLAAFPQEVLNVYCEAVKNNAQPSNLLATEMKAALSVVLIPPAPDFPPGSSVSGVKAESTSLSPGPNTSGWVSSPAFRTNTPRHPSSRLADLSNSLRHLSETGSPSYLESSYTDAGIDSTYSILSASSVSDRVSSSSFASSRCSTPLDQQGRTSGNLSLKDSAGDVKGLRFCSDTEAGPSSISKSGGCGMGSTLKYSIGSTTPLLKNVAEASPIAVVTPVRRSTRLSGRQLTPGSSLRREIASVSELSEAERQSMLFQVNPAITEN